MTDNIQRTHYIVIAKTAKLQSLLEDGDEDTFTLKQGDSVWLPDNEAEPYIREGLIRPAGNPEPHPKGTNAAGKKPRKKKAS